MAGYKINQVQRSKPLCCSYRIWWSLRNWLETRLCCLPASAPNVPGTAAFSGQTCCCAPAIILEVHSRGRSSLRGKLTEIPGQTACVHQHFQPRACSLPGRDAPGLVSRRDWCLFSYPFHWFPFYYLQGRWFIEYSSAHWKTSNTRPSKPGPIDSLVRLESCPHLGPVTAVLTVPGWMRTMLKRFKMCGKWLNSLVLHSQRKTAQKMWYITRAKSRNFQGISMALGAYLITGISFIHACMYSFIHSFAVSYTEHDIFWSFSPIILSYFLLLPMEPLQ